MNKQYSLIKQYFKTSLSPLYDELEINSLFYYYMEMKFGIKKHQFFLSDKEFVLSSSFSFIKKDLERLAQGEPVQYIVGKTEFYGTLFSVSPSVLIPRQETEELVELIIKENRKAASLVILDIGTGSGAIAISLAKHLPKATVYATDISPNALQMATFNAKQNNVGIAYHLHDILSQAIPEDFPTFDLIVSNPPYIPAQEKTKLHRNVTEFEPGTALFVPDQDPLVFYRKIAEAGSSLLKKNGKLYFETHERYHAETETLLQQLHYHSIRKMEDLNGRPRFISCTQSPQ